MNVRRILSVAALSASALAGVAAVPAAQASTPADAGVHPAGYATVISCTSLPSTTTFTPGLHRNVLRATTATISGALSGCTDTYGVDLSGTGALHANLSGNSEYGAVSEAGTFVISWPQYFNPSSGTLTLTGPAADGSYHIYGSVTSGAFVGAVVNSTFVQVATNPGATGRKGHLLTQQSLVNTAPLTLAQNFG